FAGWSGDCTGATCTLTMSANKSVTATFNTTAVPQRTLTVSKAGTGSGTVTGTGISCGADCTETYNDGTGVTLTATATSGSTFAGWSGACTNTTGTCALSMTAARSVTATFTAVTVQRFTATPAAGQAHPLTRGCEPARGDRIGRPGHAARDPLRGRHQRQDHGSVRGGRAGRNDLIARQRHADAHRPASLADVLCRPWGCRPG